MTQTTDYHNLIFFILIGAVIWYLFHWWLVSTAVQKGVKDANKGLVKLIRKNLELKGVSKEELDRISDDEAPKE